MKLKTIIATTIAAGSIALSSCSEPTIEQHKDLTGDGITDIIVNVEDGPQRGTWLYIGKEDGSFIKAKKNRGLDGSLYFFKTDQGNTYVFNGEHYIQAYNK